MWYTGKHFISIFFTIVFFPGCGSNDFCPSSRTRRARAQCTRALRKESGARRRQPRRGDSCCRRGAAKRLSDLRRSAPAAAALARRPARRVELSLCALQRAVRAVGALGAGDTRARVVCRKLCVPSLARVTVRADRSLRCCDRLLRDAQSAHCAALRAGHRRDCAGLRCGVLVLLPLRDRPRVARVLPQPLDVARQHLRRSNDRRVRASLAS